MPRRPSRKQLILETLARELERRPAGRITTANLASAAGVSEAALYRHFDGKAGMFESLIEFAERSIFDRVQKILDEERQARSRCAKLLYLLLGFAELNPGITRVLLGDMLVGEGELPRTRVEGFHQRFEEQLRQVLEAAPLRESSQPPLGAAGAANLLMTLVEGRMHRFLRSGFAQSPLEGWDAEWSSLSRCLFLLEAAT